VAELTNFADAPSSGAPMMPASALVWRQLSMPQALKKCSAAMSIHLK
jgi:hypothetical protein